MSYDHVCEPRLSTRSSLALFHAEAPEVEELEHIRRTSFAEYSNRTAQPNFSIDLFLPKSTASSTSVEVKSIRNDFRFFLQQVSAIADGGAQEQDAARTMYNIVVRRKDSKDLAFTDAVSYFGKIPLTKFELIRTAALDLYQASLRLSAPAIKSGSQGPVVEYEFGSKITYHIPELIDDTTDSEYSVFSPNEEAYRKSARGHSDSRSIQENRSVNENSGAAKHLLQLCSDYVQSTNFTMESERLAEEIIKIFQNGANDDAIQAQLFELVGEAGFEFMFALMQDAGSFRWVSISDLKQEGQLQQEEHAMLLNSQNFMSSEGLFGMMSTAQTAAAFPSLSEDLVGLSVNQRRKREKKDRERVEREAECLSTAMQDPSMAYLIQAGFSEVIRPNNSIELDLNHFLPTEDTLC
jgi:hypothetical protein